MVARMNIMPLRPAEQRQPVKPVRQEKLQRLVTKLRFYNHTKISPDPWPDGAGSLLIGATIDWKIGVTLYAATRAVTTFKDVCDALKTEPSLRKHIPKISLASRLVGWAAFASAWAYGVALSTAATPAAKIMVMLMLIGSGVALVTQRIARAVGLRRSARQLLEGEDASKDFTMKEVAAEIKTQQVPESIQERIVSQFQGAVKRKYDAHTAHFSGTEFRRELGLGNKS